MWPLAVAFLRRRISVNVTATYMVSHRVMSAERCGKKRALASWLGTIFSGFFFEGGTECTGEMGGVSKASFLGYIGNHALSILQ